MRDKLCCYKCILPTILYVILSAVLLLSCASGNKNIPGSEHIRDAEILTSDVKAAADTVEVKKNPYADLSIPTQITKIGDTYFIVDCYHDQVIYNDDLETPLSDWNVMTDEMSMGHTIAGDGRVYLVDDTENERVMIFEKAEGEEDKYVFSQQFSDIKGRPHYIIYDEKTKTFYVWCSVSGRMYLFKDDEEGPVYLAAVREIPELDGIYVRSFTIIDDDIYFVSGNSSIIKAVLNTFEIKERYPVPSSMAGMVQLTRIDDMFYITISTDAMWDQDYATIIRCRKLEDLAKGEYEDIYDSFIGGGTPYYITSFDNAYYMTEHRIPGHSIWRFNVDNGKITSETVY